MLPGQILSLVTQSAQQTCTGDAPQSRQMPALSRYPLAEYLSRLLSMLVRAISS